MRQRDDLSEKKVMVTGGAGFIGSHLADELGGISEVVIYDEMEF